MPAPSERPASHRGGFWPSERASDAAVPGSAVRQTQERRAPSEITPTRPLARPRSCPPHPTVPSSGRAGPRLERGAPPGTAGNPPPPSTERSGLFTVLTSAAGGNPRLQLLLTSPRRASAPSTPPTHRRADQPPGLPQSPAPWLATPLPSPRRPT